MSVATFIARNISHASVGAPVFPIHLPSVVTRPVFLKTNTRRCFHDFHDRTSTLFVHIPKAAGTSLLDALYDHKVVGHPLLIEYFLVDPERYRRYWKFTVTRNPFDRLVSAFHYAKRGGGNSGTKKWAEQHLGNCANFAEFIEHISDSSVRAPIFMQQFFRPQNHFLRGPSGEIELDFIGKMEDLDRDYATIRTKVAGSSPELPHRNATNRQDHRSYYDSSARALVEEIYADDLELFGYTF